MPDECSCPMCIEINAALAAFPDADLTNVTTIIDLAVSELLSEEVREILIAQHRVRMSTAALSDIALVREAALRCTATTFRRLPTAGLVQ